MERIISKLLLATLLSAALLWPQLGRAADQQVELNGPVGVVKVGQTFRVAVRFSNQVQAVNVLDLTLSYPTNIIRLNKIDRDQSVLTLWPEEPRWDSKSGTIHLVGGRPNGLFASKATIINLEFTALISGPATIRLNKDTSAVYLNDNQGTKVSLAEVALTLDVASEFVGGIDISSATNPTGTIWNQTGEVLIEWTVMPATEYSYSFSLDPEAKPTAQSQQTDGRLAYHNLVDGRYSFTIQSRPMGGNWSAITQRWFLVDQ